MRIEAVFDFIVSLNEPVEGNEKLTSSQRQESDLSKDELCDLFADVLERSGASGSH